MKTQNTPSTTTLETIDLDNLATVTGGQAKGCAPGTEWSPSAAKCVPADDGSAPFMGN
jgi:hypothetical protein